MYQQALRRKVITEFNRKHVFRVKAKMNLKIIRFLILGSVVLLVFVSCNYQDKHRMPGIQIPEEDMNRQIELLQPNEGDRLQQGHPIPLVFVNHSENPITVTEKDGIHIFQLLNEEWVEIENQMDYPSDDIIIYPKANRQYQPVWTVVNPVYFSEEPISIRIVIIGNFYSQEANEKADQVGSQIDLTLDP